MAPQLCVNPEFRYAPAEMHDFDTMYAFFSYGVTSTRANRNNQPVGEPTTAGRALLRRSSPGPWQLLFDSGDGSYLTLKESTKKPEEDEIRQVLGEAIKRAGDTAKRGPGESERTAMDPSAASLESLFNMEVGARSKLSDGEMQPPSPDTPPVVVTEGTRALTWGQIQASSWSEHAA